MPVNVIVVDVNASASSDGQVRRSGEQGAALHAPERQQRNSADQGAETAVHERRSIGQARLDDRETRGIDQGKGDPAEELRVWEPAVCAKPRLYRMVSMTAHRGVAG